MGKRSFLFILILLVLLLGAEKLLYDAGERSWKDGYYIFKNFTREEDGFIEFD